ncbi:uncharacterized protein BX664DRAFT_333565 [Halteromyces radiatus]|uniref:uncharacterized protein n=1 Tax=Halteromyces radiatus TaxID=101107 RepID=UPI002220DA50|nr:uncharacterized protein BX664DRAFT_333565 [Halteromyces radiatus]KAI8089653.1 hypothetical protein BX664DRAFT_333565 [Halteromyces radiatus]
MTGSKQKHYRNNYKVKSHRGGKGKHGYKAQHLQHFNGISTETVTEADIDRQLLQTPSFAHLDIGSDCEQDPDDDRPSFHSWHSNRPTFGLGYRSSVGNNVQQPLEPDDNTGFFYDDTPSTIQFTRATMVVNDQQEETQIVEESETWNTNQPSQAPDNILLDTKRNRKHKKKVKQANKIIPGDDIHISCSDDDELSHSSKWDKDNQAAIDQDFMENTDSDTWQALQQWAISRPVDDQQAGRLDDHLSTDEEDNDHQRKTILSQVDDDEDLCDFGLEDSDDDEYLKRYAAEQEYQQHMAQQMHYTIQNTMAAIPPSLHAGMQGYLHYNQQYTHPHRQQTYPNLRWTNSMDKNSISGQLRRVDTRIQLFLSDQSRTTYQLPGMSTYCRRLVQGLATQYGLKLSHEPVGDKIGPLLRKGPKSHLPYDRRTIEKHINKKRTPAKAKKQMERKPDLPATEKRTRIRKGKHGTVVGSDAAPLASNNIGHKMLAAMGWKEGDALGANKDGIADPIQAVIRDKRRGLGA